MNRGISPLVFGGLIAAALLAAVVLVVRSTMADTGSIDAATDRALAGYGVSNVGQAVGELPTFAAPSLDPVVTLYPTATDEPTITPTATPTDVGFGEWVMTAIAPEPTAIAEIYALLTAPPPVVIDPPTSEPTYTPAPVATLTPEPPTMLSVYDVALQNNDEWLIWTSAGQWLSCNDIWGGYGNTTGINAGAPLDGWFSGLDRATQNIYRDICAYHRNGGYQ